MPVAYDAITPTIRLAILMALAEEFRAVRQGAPAEDPFPWGFEMVEIGHLDEPNARKFTAIGIVAGTEVKDTAMYPVVTPVLPLTIEFRLAVQAGMPKPAIMAEHMLGTVQRVLYKDRTLGGLCADILETGNQIDLDTWGDRYIAGVVEANVVYRHDQDDPRVA